MTEFTASNGKLFINDKEIITAWESFSGWYWFATEKSYKQDSVIDGKVFNDDQIYFGFVQGWYDEWGYWSETELNLQKPLVWEIKKQDLPCAGRRKKERMPGTLPTIGDE